VWNSWASLSWVLVGLLYLWIASQAGRFYIEARQSGFLELLLVAPPSVKEVVGGHWRALLRMFGVPVALLLLAELAGGCLAYGATWGNLGSQKWGPLVVFVTAAASTLGTLASLLALAWFGMWMGMTSRKASLATLKTLLFVKVIPFLVIYFVAMYVTFLVIILPQTLKMTSGSTTVTTTSGSTTVTAGSIAMTPAMLSLLMTCLPAALSVAAGLAFLAWARHRLYSAFRQQAARDLGPPRLGPAPVSAPPSPMPPRPATPPPGGK
jgi:hypothetical protein